MSGESDPGMPGDEPEEEYWALLSNAGQACGTVLAELESMRRHCEADGQLPAAWALALLERLACTFEFGSREHLAVHAQIVRAMRAPLDRIPPDAAVIAHAVHSTGE